MWNSVAWHQLNVSGFWVAKKLGLAEPTYSEPRRVTWNDNVTEQQQEVTARDREQVRKDMTVRKGRWKLDSMENLVVSGNSIKLLSGKPGWTGLPGWAGLLEIVIWDFQGVLPGGTPGDPKSG